MDFEVVLQIASLIISRNVSLLLRPESMVVVAVGSERGNGKLDDVFVRDASFGSPVESAG